MLGNSQQPESLKEDPIPLVTQDTRTLVHAFNPSICEAEAGGSKKRINLRNGESMSVQRLPGVALMPLIPALGPQSQENLKEESIKKKFSYRETLSRKTKKNFFFKVS